jgi:hypothetical protein
MLEIIRGRNNSDDLIYIDDEEQIERRIFFKPINNLIIQKELIIIDSNYNCLYYDHSFKVYISKGINRFEKFRKLYNSLIGKKLWQHSLMGREKFRIIIEDEYNLIVLTVFQMTDWREILQSHSLFLRKDYSFYLNSDRLHENNTLEKILIISIMLEE